MRIIDVRVEPSPQITHRDLIRDAISRWALAIAICAALVGIGVWGHRKVVWKPSPEFLDRVWIDAVYSDCDPEWVAQVFHDPVYLAIYEETEEGERLYEVLEPVGSAWRRSDSWDIVIEGKRIGHTLQKYGASRYSIQSIRPLKRAEAIDLPLACSAILFAIPSSKEREELAQSLEGKVPYAAMEVHARVIYEHDSYLQGIYIKAVTVRWIE